ncbi:MAG: ribonuclease Z [Nitritalea sp.]
MSAETFDITILGANSAVPAHGRHPSSQYVRIGQDALLIDCGEGTQMQLKKFRCKLNRIAYIFISHLHGDHFYGLIGLLSSMQLQRRERLLTLIGPPGLDEIITVQLKHSQSALEFPLRFIAVQPTEKELLVEEPDYRVYGFPLQHRIPCTGFLIEEKIPFRKLKKEALLADRPPVEVIKALREGREWVDPQTGEVRYPLHKYAYPSPQVRSYAYCSDTKYFPELADMVRGVSLMYHESTFSQADAQRALETGHSTTRDAAFSALRADAAELLLGHFSSRYVDLAPLLAEAQTIFPSSYLSEEGKTFIPKVR